MNKFFRITLVVLFIVISVAAVAIVYITSALPNVGEAPTLKVVATPEKIERGRYLANAVCICMDCHSVRDWSRFSGPMLDSTLGRGGESFDARFGFPGTFISRNITPFGISRYTDGELFRVLTTGVTKEGKPLFPIMPYTHLGKMDESDITSIIAYLRTLPEQRNVVPPSKADFPVSVIIHLMPKKATFSKLPDSANKLAYGQYLVNAAGCIECHTPAKQGQIIESEAFSGGREFVLPTGGKVRSANITPDVTTGIGNWTEETFLDKFKANSLENNGQKAVAKNTFNSMMPWTMYARMKPSDLSAIFTYLKSLPAKSKSIEKFIPD